MIKQPLAILLASNLLFLQIYPPLNFCYNSFKTDIQIEHISAESIGIPRPKPKEIKEKIEEQPKEEIEVIENFETKEVPCKSAFKSYMSYKAITNKASKQYKMQQEARTGDYGIRMFDDRYCVAVGTYFDADVGTKIDVVMENGFIIECIVGDIKAVRDTDSMNIRTADGSVIEFIVDMNSLHKEAKYHGDMSHCIEDFDGEILEIKVYNNEE